MTNSCTNSVDHQLNVDLNNSQTVTNPILDVIFDYTANGDDELTLRRGSKLEVLSRDESISGSEGWWTGRLIDSNSVGVFPANFVTEETINLEIIKSNDLQIGETIDVGGFGYIYRGKFCDIDVAIKTAKSLASFCSVQSRTTPADQSNGDDTSEAVQKILIDGLLREARLFSQLKHRNIIQFYGVCPCLSTRNLYLVMEYAHGGSLSSILQRRKSGLYPDVFLEYAKQIAEGMKYLHEEASETIVHRDLKSSNILILEQIDDVFNDEDLIRKTLKITDFGLARKQVQSSTVSAAGTFAWMSPECIRENKFSSKSDVWSFGVLLWECLTGEFPYQGFDQMQIAFGIATYKYSLPIPSTCPDDFAQLMKNCWKISVDDRPTFSELILQIEKIVPNDVHPIELREESYQSLQEDWRQEIQQIFDELKEKEKEIRDREQAVLQLSLEQNHQRVQLEQWEQKLHEREMHLVECELKLLMATMNQERLTPKVQKRSGRFMRSFLNLNPNQQNATSNFIGPPTNFRHLISVCHNPQSNDFQSSSINGNRSPSTSSAFSNSSPKLGQIKNESISSSSTPTTPNLNRYRTLTFHFPVQTDDSNSSTPLEKPTRSSSSSRILSQRFHRSKSKLNSNNSKRLSSKKNRFNAEPKWYLENFPSINTNNNNNNNDSSAKSTPVLDRPSRKSDSASTCSTPNEKSLARAFSDINSMLAGIILGRSLKFFSSSNSSSTNSISTNETNKICSKIRQTFSPSTTDESVKTRSRSYLSPARPNSLVLSTSSKLNVSSQQTSKNDVSTDLDFSQNFFDDENESFYSAQSSNISTPMIQPGSLLSSLKSSGNHSTNDR